MVGQVDHLDVDANRKVIASAGVATLVVVAGVVGISAAVDTTRFGNAAEWIGGLATAGALWFTGLELRDQRRTAERERRAALERELRAQADMVSAWCEGTHVRSGPQGAAITVSVTVRNASEHPVYRSAIRVYPDGEWGPEASNWVKMELGTIGPGKTKTVGATRTGPVRHNLENETPIAVEFSDAGGRRWMRQPDGRLDIDR